MKRMGLWAAAFCLLLAACAPASPPVPSDGPAATAAETTAADPATTTAAAATTAAGTTSFAKTTAAATAVSVTSKTAAATTVTTKTAAATTVTSKGTAAPATTAAVPTTTAAAAPTLPEPVPVPADLWGVAPFGLGFLAVGDGGTVALLDPEGTLSPLPSPTAARLRAAASLEGIALIAGEGGALFTFDGEVFAPVAGAEEDLLCIARFGDLWYIGGAGAALYSFDGALLTRLPLPLQGDLTGLAAGHDRLMGVTSLGEWFTLLPEGARQIGTANADLQGEERIGFLALTEANGLFWATARTGAGEAAVLTTLYGGVWTRRPLTTLEGGPFDPAGLELRGICAEGEQAAAAANGGRLLILPDCLACNKFISPGSGAGDFLAVARGGGLVAAVGRSMAAAVTDDETARQYKIAVDTARILLEQGAALIDVRGEEEYAARHIAGSVNIPVASLAEELPARYPDRGTALIFYCAKGIRSADAAKAAAALGYSRAYTAGGIDDGDWDYEAG